MRTRSAVRALLALPTLASAVSLADLAPRAQNLPPDCNAIYIQQVPGCTAHDFITMNCSDACITGLESLVQPIMQACGDRGVVGENLVVAYLVGKGPKQICHNAPPESGNGVPPPQSQSQPWTSQTSSSQTPSSTPSTSFVTSGTSTASSASSAYTSLLVDTTPLPASSRAVSTSTQASSSARATETKSSSTDAHHGVQRPTMTQPSPTVNPNPRIQQSSSTAAVAAQSSGPAYGQTHSGTGSPFDIAGSGASGNAAASLLTVSLAVGFALLACVR